MPSLRPAIALLLGLVLSVARSGYSQPQPQAPGPSSPAPPTRPEVTVAYYWGGALTLDSSLHVSQPGLGSDLTLAPVHYDSRSFQSRRYYGIRLGFFPQRRAAVGVEAEFIHLKAYADTSRTVRASGTFRRAPIDQELPFAQVVQRYAISHGLNLLLINLAVRRLVEPGRDGRARLILIGRLGAGPTISHTESQIDGHDQEQFEVGGLAWQAAGGAEWRLWRGLYATGEYKFTRTNQHGTVFEGEAETLMRSHHGTFGVSYYF